MSMSEADLAALVGHSFPGGTYRIAHWENWLLTDCTGSAQLPDGLVHPVALFHVSILGSHLSIQDLFTLLRTSGPASVGLLGYDWEYFQPLREDVDYACTGSIISAEREVNGNGHVSDVIAFAIDLTDDRGHVTARVTNRWRVHRSRG